MIHTAKARLHFPDGRVVHYENQSLAYQVWLSFPQGIRVAFRGAGDCRPVYPWDYADRRGS